MSELAGFKVNEEFNVDGVDRTSYKHNERLIHSLARKHIWKLESAGHFGMTYDDVVQDICMIYLKAVEGYKPETGIRFSTYFVTSVWRDLSKTMDKLYRRWPVQGILLGDRLRSIDDDGDPELDIEDESATLPEDAIWRGQAIAYASKRLDGMAKVVLEAMVNPCSEMMMELDASAGKGNITMLSTKEGMQQTYRGALNVSFVVHWLLRDHQLPEKKILFLAKKIRGQFSEVAKELEAM